MAVEPVRLDFDEFAQHLPEVFDRLKREGRPVVVDRDGELYRIEPPSAEPYDFWQVYDVARALEALRASAGALRGVDTAELLADIHAQRGQDSRGRPSD